MQTIVHQIARRHLDCRSRLVVKIGAQDWSVAMQFVPSSIPSPLLLPASSSDHNHFTMLDILCKQMRQLLQDVEQDQFQAKQALPQSTSTPSEIALEFEKFRSSCLEVKLAISTLQKRLQLLRDAATKAQLLEEHERVKEIIKTFLCTPGRTPAYNVSDFYDKHLNTSEQKKLKHLMTEEYALDLKDTGAANHQRRWCHVTKQYFFADRTICAHIVPKAMRMDCARTILGEDDDRFIWSWQNTLSMHIAIERAFDRGHFVIVPADGSEFAERPEFKIKVVNKDAAHTLLTELDRDGTSTTLAELDGSVLGFKNDKRPSRRFLFFRMIVSLVCLDMAVQHQLARPVEGHLDALTAQPAWPSPGRDCAREFLIALSELKGFSTDAFRERAAALVELGRTETDPGDRGPVPPGSLRAKYYYDELISQSYTSMRRTKDAAAEED